MRLTFLALTPLLWAAGKVLAGKLSATDTITWGGDNSRTGYSSTHNMDPSVVGSSQFGRLWKALLPGNYRGTPEQIFSQPLVYTLDDGIQYVFLATTQNNVYKVNAKTGEIVASRNLHVPFLTSDLDGCVDINPHIGVTATGVIDPSTDTWYLTAKTYVDQSDAVKGRANGRYWYHAINVNTLAEKDGFPQNLEGTIARNNPNRMFQGGNAHQRPGLLLSGQHVYAGFASHCVQYNFTGWIMGWDKTSGALVEHFATQGGPEPNTVKGGGVWMSGGGLASDDKGSMFFATGNGYASQLSTTPVPGRQPPTSLEEAAVNMKINSDGTLTVVDFFMPWEKTQLDGADKDLGTSPLELLQTDVFTCPNVKRLGVVTGKSGKTYWLNLDNLGGYQQGANKLDAVPQVTQNENSVYAGAGVYPLEGGYIYINVIQYPTHVFKFSCNANGDPVFTKVADSPQKNAYILGVGHGTTTSLNGQSGTGLVWVSDVEGSNLRVYKAVPQNGLLELIQSANIEGVTKFTRPVFGDGRVYIGTTLGALHCFGSPVNLPLTCSSPNDFGNVSINSTSSVKTIQCKANVNAQVTGINLKGNANFQIAGQPSLPFTVTAGNNVSFQVTFNPTSPGPLSSDVLLDTINGAAGYALTTPVSLKGVGDSADPLLAVSPNTVTFNGVITGQQEGGVTQSIIFSNQGDGPLTIVGLDYSVISETGAFVQPTTTSDGVKIGPFTFKDLPTSIPGNGQATIDIVFDPSTNGNFAVYVHVRSNGGTKIFDVFGTAATNPVALLEFQAADGSGAWIEYTHDSPPFTFGDVYEQQTKVLKMRLTNKGESSAASLSVTVSKPPFGVPGIIGAQNQVDLGEGTALGAGESASANLFCSVPKSQVNVDSYSGSAVWTLNVGDPNFGKQFINFTCNAVAEQVGPLYANGSATYRYAGCYKENNPGRQLKTQVYGSQDNTNDICIAACGAQQYAFAGTQYLTECWCGNNIPILKSTDADCNYACSGNKNETCGGNGYFNNGDSFISLFSNGLGGSGPTVVPSVGGFNYSGCYTEATNGRALSGKTLNANDMTIEHCASNCTSYKYFGVEFGSECYCGNTLGAGTVKAAGTDCSMTCPGNPNEICGNGNRLTLYAVAGQASLSSSADPTTSTSVPVPTGPITVQSAGSFNFTGCYTEATTGRALTGSALANNAMTVEKCAAFCAAYTYMGIEYASECYCGNTIAAGSILAASGCSMTCSGNSSEYCGGPNRLDLYTAGSATAGTSTGSTTSVATPTPTGPITVQSVGKFNFTGCYTEDTAGRALTGSTLANNDMTVEKCAAFCAAYTYMGIEYASECYCGNILAAGAVFTASGCSMTCSGNSSEYCGGPNRLDLYTAGSATPGTSTGSTTSVTTPTTSVTTPTSTGPIAVQSAGNFNFTGCYTEATTGRALTGSTLANNDMTVEKCAAFCAAYTYMGIEYASECYCGNTLSAGSILAASGCSMTCSGNSSEYCGGPNRLNFYTANSARSIRSTTSVAATTSSTITPVSTPTDPIIIPGDANFTYLGCYVEPANSRALSSLVLDKPQMTVEICLSACSQYIYAGLEYRRYA
ncbi:hypothetical protein MMC29_004955 [Sticta canariensis]|nr:hypothetical protein [Sticta canariensis]